MYDEDRYERDRNSSHNNSTTERSRIRKLVGPVVGALICVGVVAGIKMGIDAGNESIRERQELERHLVSEIERDGLRAEAVNYVGAEASLLLDDCVVRTAISSDAEDGEFSMSSGVADYTVSRWTNDMRVRRNTTFTDTDDLRQQVGENPCEFFFAEP